MGGPNLPKETTPGRPVEPHVQHSGETVPAAVRAQILATEHWSLLGTRATTWTEAPWYAWHDVDRGDEPNQHPAEGRLAPA